jgi:putative ABC transport system substrate-binding protein
MAQEQVEGFILTGSPLFTVQRAFIAELALKYRLPGVGDQKGQVDAGNLLSYGADIDDLSRRAAVYVDKILKGAKPSDLPVEQASKYELAINLKTAKTLGIEIPPSLLARADEVIE